MRRVISINEINSQQPTIIKFGAAWCGPCKNYTPIFDRISNNEKYSSILFYECDIDSSAQIKNEESLVDLFAVVSVPTTIILSGGEEIGRFTGNNEVRLIEWCEKLI